MIDIEKIKKELGEALSELDHNKTAKLLHTIHQQAANIELTLGPNSIISPKIEIKKKQPNFNRGANPNFQSVRYNQVIPNNIARPQGSDNPSLSYANVEGHITQEQIYNNLILLGYDHARSKQASELFPNIGAAIDFMNS